MSQSFFITFGQKHGQNPGFRKGATFMPHPDGFVEIVADDLDAARAKAMHHFDGDWARVYDGENFRPEFYPRGCLTVIQ